MISLTRRYRFASSHRLHSTMLSESENALEYGKCNNPYGHGHDYALEVTVSGPVDEATGRVVSPGELESWVASQVLRTFDHRDMNHDMAEFRDRVPTAENIAAVIGEMLRQGWSDAFPGRRITGIRIEETARNSAELRPG